MDLEEIQKRFCSILADPDFMKLKNIKRHGSTDTYTHSLRVGIMASEIAKKLGCSEIEAAKAGILHDFCLVDHHAPNSHPGCYLFYHPIEAVNNSKKFGLTKNERNAIRSHMFPAGPVPTNRVAIAVTLADKYVALAEVRDAVVIISKKTSLAAIQMFA